MGSSVNGAEFQNELITHLNLITQLVEERLDLLSRLREPGADPAALKEMAIQFTKLSLDIGALVEQISPLITEARMQRLLGAAKPPLPVYEALADYPLLAQRPSLDSAENLRKMLEQLPRPLTLPATSSGAPSSERPVRFLHVSDTHSHHDQVHLPPADVLLHTGDLTFKYGSVTVEKQLGKVLEWFQQVSKTFELVVFIAGNHDTVLDPTCDKDKAEKDKFLQSLPANCRYLDGNSVEFRGIKIWGSPVTACRYESQGKRHPSNAFERSNAKRQSHWAAISEDVDVLMTHVPPQGVLSRGVGCELLAERLRQLQPGPRFHCFGHDHDYHGVEVKNNTIHLNGALDQVWWKDKDAKACPWVFDVEPRRA